MCTYLGSFRSAYSGSRKIYKFYLSLFLFLLIQLTTPAQTPQWYWTSIGTSVGDYQDMAVDAMGNSYVFTRYESGGELLGVKFNSAGTIQWITRHTGAAEANVTGVLFNSAGRLFVGMNTQTNTAAIAQMTIIEIDPSTGAIITAIEYTDATTSHFVNDLALQPNGTDLMLVAEDVILFVDASDLSVQSQWRQGTDPALSLTTTNIATALSESDVTSTLSTSGFENTPANMPFYVGSPLANTQPPTDATNYTFPAEVSATSSVNATLASSNTPWTGGSSVNFRAAAAGTDGSIFVYFTMTLSSNEHQGVARLNAADIYTTDWGKVWRQDSGNPGSLVVDESNNVYLYSWDNLYGLISSGGVLDVLATKFNGSNGTLLWGKAYGAAGGNEVIWRSGGAKIDRTNGEIVLNFYTDSYNMNNPGSLLLSTNYAGEIQNYSILAPTGGSVTPIALALDGQGNAFIAGQSGAGPLSVAKVNTTTLLLNPQFVSATKDSDIQITVTMSVNVATNGGNPEDFTVTDALGTDFAVSEQADGTGGDPDIMLTVASLSTAVGDLTVTYTNNNNEITSISNSLPMLTDNTGVSIDSDTSAPTMSSGTRNSDTELIITFNEPVQTNGTNPTDFTVKDAAMATYTVFSQSDGTANDTDIALIVANTSGATGPLTVTYTNSNSEISDFGGNEMATDATGIDVALLPVISSVSLAADNSYIDVTFNTPVYNSNGGSGALEVSDFNLGIASGSATAPTISSVKKDDNTSEVSATVLAGGETTIRIFFSVTGTPDGSETLTVSPVTDEIYDGSGGAALSTQSNNTTTLNDQFGPTVTNVTSSTADGTLKLNDCAVIQVTFSEAVTVVGFPTVKMETGDTDQTINVNGGSFGSGTTTLEFLYCVGSGESSADLEYFDVNALEAGAGVTIRDAAGNDATLTLPTIGGGNSLSDNKDLVIDAIAPTVTSVSSTASTGSYKEGDVIPVTVTFSEAVTVTGTPQIELETGTTDQTVDYTSGSTTTTLTFDYTVQAGDTNGGGLEYTSTNALTLNSGTIKDAAGNDATLTLASPGATGSISSTKSITIDTTVPTVTDVTSTVSSGTYNEGDVIPITVTFSEAVTVTGTPQIELETGTTDQVIDYSSGSGTITLTFNYTVQAGDTNGGGLEYTSSNALMLNGGTIQDDAGNDATLTLAAPGASGSISNTKSISIDTTVPTVTSVSSTFVNGSYKESVVIPILVNFSEAVSVTGTPQLELETGTTDQTIDYTSGSGTTSLTFTYTVQAGDESAALDYTSTTALNLNGGTIKDEAGNDATLTLASPGATGALSNALTLTIDTTAPTVTNVTSSTADGTLILNDCAIIQVTFSEAVTVTGFPTLKMETGDTDQTINVNGGSFGSGTTTLEFQYCVGTGESSSDLEYFDINALEAGAGVTIRDAAGNDATLTLPTIGGGNSLSDNKDLVIDAIAPTVTSVSSTASTGSYKEGDVIPVTVTFSEAVTVTGTPQIELETGTTDQTVDYTSGSTTTTLTFDYTVQAGDTNGGGLEYTSTNALTLNSGTIKDAAGNDATLTLASPGATGSISSTKSITIDTTVPTVTDVTSTVSSGTYNEGDVIPITVTFSEAVTVTGTPQIELETGTTDQVIDYSSGSGTITLTFNYTVQAGDTNGGGLEYTSSNALMLNGGTIQDDAGNDATLTLAAPGASGSISNTKSISIDTTVPTVTSVSSTFVNGSYKESVVIPILVNFSEAVSVTGTPQLELETGTTDQTIDYTSGSGTTSLTFTYTVQAGDESAALDYTSTTALNLNGGTIKDEAGNDATLTLASPGATGALSNALTLTIDTTAPTVTNVTSSTADGTLILNDCAIIQVTFSEAVTVTGFPTLKMETGDTDQTINVNGGSFGSGTTTLEFQYCVGTGESSSDLEYFDINALEAASGVTIQDAAGNDATLTLPTIGGGSSLSDNKDLVVDAVAPTVNDVTSTVSTGSYKAGDVIPVTVTFSEAVTVTGTPQIELETGDTDQTVDYASGSGTTVLTFNYTVQTGDTNGGGLEYTSTAALTLNGGMIQDAAGNDATITLASPGATGSISSTKSITIDTSAPTVSNVTSSSDDGSYKTNDEVNVQVVFNEAVTISDLSQLQLQLETGTLDYYIAAVSGSGTTTINFTYTVQTGTESSDLDYISANALELSTSATVQDDAGNDAVLTLPAPGATNSLAGNKDLVIDGVTPTVSSVSSTSSDGAFKEGDVIPITITFSEVMTVTGTPQLEIETGTTDALIDYTSGSATTTLTFDYTIQAGDTSDDLEYTSTTSFTLNSGTIQDDAGNDATLTLPTIGGGNSLSDNKNLIIDGVVPTVTITSDASDPHSGAFTATFTFSEDVTGFASEDITVGNGTASDFQTSSASVYTATITPASDGDVTIDVGADLSTDIAGNNNTAATQLSITNDETAPTITITSSADPTSGAFTATFTFSEDVTGFASEDITVGNGASSDFQSTSATVYTATITPSADGDVTVDVAADKATDAAGNNNIAATQLSVTNDETGPTVVITSDATDPQNGAFTATFTFSEDVTGFAVEDVTVGNGTASDLQSTSATVYTVTITPAEDGAVTIDVDADKATDAAENGNSAATQLSVDTDQSSPTISITSSESDPTNNASFGATITFNEAVSGFVEGDVTVGNATLSDFATTDDTNFTFTLTPTADGSVTVDVSAGVATDAAGNSNGAATQFSIESDQTAPTVSISGVPSEVTEAFTITITFSEEVTGFEESDISLSNSTLSNFAASSNTEYTATITPTGNFEISVPADSYTDLAGNLGSSTSVSGTYSTLAGDINGDGVIGDGEVAGDIDGDGIIGTGEVAGDTNGDGSIGDGEIAGDANGDGSLGTGELAGDINGDGSLGTSEIAGDTNGDGSIGSGEIAGDADGDGSIGSGELAGDINGDGSIGTGEIAGDTNGDGSIGDGEIAGDANGDGSLATGELAGDINGDGSLGTGEIAGDTNGDGSIGSGEIAGDADGDGSVGSGELAGDINGDGSIGTGEIAGDTNGDGSIGDGEIAGDTNGDGSLGTGELAGDINGDGSLGTGEIAGDTNGDGSIGSGEIAGDANGDGSIGTGELAGDINGDGNIGDGEVVGDIDGDGTVDGSEIAGDTNGDGSIGTGELAGDINGDGSFGTGEIAGDLNGDGSIASGEIAGDTSGDGTIGTGELAGDVNGDGSIGSGEIAGDMNGDGGIGDGEFAGDTNGDGTIGSGELAGDINGDGSFGTGEIAGDVNGDGSIGSDEIAGDTTGDGVIGTGELAGDVNGDGTIGEAEVAGDTDGNGSIDGSEIAGDVNGDGSIGTGEIAGDVNGDGTIGNGEVAGDLDGNGTVDEDEVLSVGLTSNISLYPNPAQDQITLESIPSKKSISIVNIDGKKMELSIKEESGKLIFNIKDYPSGVYFILLETKDSVNSFRFLKL